MFTLVCESAAEVVVGGLTSIAALGFMAFMVWLVYR